MKKIGIITTSCVKNGTYGCNYGAALQGYALVKVLRDMGYDAHDINYTSDNEYRPQQYTVIKRTLLRAGLLFNFSLVKQKIAEFRIRDCLTQNRLQFQKFIVENDLTYLNGRFFDIRQLSLETSDFYAVITGSDVVWNPTLHKNINDPGYFLDFANTGVKRIAYAPSFGVTVLPEESRKTLKSYLEKFDALSIREKSGSDLIKEETGLDVPVVLDPTLLLEPSQYKNIENPIKDLPPEYILVYKFGNLNHTQSKIREISQRLGVPVIYVPSGPTNEYDIRYDFGPGEFIYAIRHAKLVISDSFHCTVFSLISHVPFLTFYRSVPEPGKDLNTRMINLLETVGLANRMVRPGEEVNYSCLLSVDFTDADNIIMQKRIESRKYLQKALEE